MICARGAWVRAGATLSGGWLGGGAGSNNNVWESSVVSADDLARSFGLADKKRAAPQQLRRVAHMAVSQTVFHQDCSGGDCHYD